MKRILLIGLSACALALNTKAETVLQQMGAAMELQAQALARREAREEYKEAMEAARAQAQALAEHKAKMEAVLRGELSAEAIMDPDLVHCLKYQKLQSKLWHAEQPVVDGDPLPLPNQYDDAATIKMYLRDSGYSDLSDAQIAKVSAYMKAKGIYHVSELDPTVVLNQEKP